MGILDRLKGKKSKSRAKKTNTGMTVKEQTQTEVRGVELTVTDVERRGTVFVVAVKGTISVQPSAEKARDYNNLVVGSRFDLENL